MTTTTSIDQTAPEDQQDPVEALPVPVRATLTAAAEWIAAADGRDVPALDVASVRDLLRLLSESAPLRQLLALELPQLPHGLACDLLAVDDASSGRAATRIEALLTDAMATASKQRRAARRAARGSVEDRAASRHDDQVAELRRTRDTERAKREAAQAEIAALRGQLAELGSELEDATGRLAASGRQLAHVRSRMAEPGQLSALLADALTPTAPETDTDTDGAAAAGTLPIPGPGADLSLPDGVSLDSLVATLRHIAAPPARTSDRELRVEVLGGGDEIGGSCVLISAGDTRILVDCGARPQGKTAADVAPRGYARALDGPIDAVVVTHAHNDHAGWVPALLKTRPGTPVYATRATCDLLYTMWRDSAKVLGRNGVEAYDLSDVARAVDCLEETSFSSTVRVKDLVLELFAAGHIIGAAGVVVTAGEYRVVVSGDVSGPGQETVGGFRACASAQGADLLLLESTYAGDAHTSEPRSKVVGEFIRTVERVTERGGIALVPAFALGRAQEVALLCARYLPQVPVLVDGMAREVSDVYERHLGAEGKSGRIFSDRVRKVPAGGTRTAAANFRGGVVVTTSGMLTQGPAITWAKRVLPDPDSALMVVGYQDEESPGRALLRLAGRGGGVFDLPGMDGEKEPVDVFAEVGRYQLGAHANADELARIVDQTRPQRVMLVHGEPDGQAKFTTRLRQRSHATAPVPIWTP